MGREQIHEDKMAALRAAWDAAKADGDYLPHLRELHLKQLEVIAFEKELGVSHARIVASGPGGVACTECQKLNNRIVPLEKETKDPQLPNANCTCRGYHDHQDGFCLCYYEIVFDDEL